jgi:AcrR family transcriptional regulator
MPRSAGTGATRRSEKWQARRKAIVDTSARVFARHGYHATGITELCEANDLGKGALYHYIGSKEELLAAIHDRVMDEVMAGADRVAQAGGTPPAQLAMLGDELLDVIHRYPDHVWVFLHEFPALTGERATQFRGRRGEYERRVEDVLRAGVESGDFRDLDPWLTARAWLGMHNYTYLWLKPGGRLTARDVAKPFAEIFMRGIESAPRTRSTSRRRVAAVDNKR